MVRRLFNSVNHGVLPSKRILECTNYYSNHLKSFKWNHSRGKYIPGYSYYFFCSKYFLDLWTIPVILLSDRFRFTWHYSCSVLFVVFAMFHRYLRFLLFGLPARYEFFGLFDVRIARSILTVPKKLIFRRSESPGVSQKLFSCKTQNIVQDYEIHF